MATTRILISDYDGTFHCGREGQLGLNAAAVSRWRQAGGIFGLATGRGREMTKLAVRESGLAADFYLCSNGGEAYGADWLPLFKSPLPQYGLKDYARFLAESGAVHIVFNGAETWAMVTSDGHSWLRGRSEFKHVSYAGLHSGNEVVQLSAAYNSAAEAQAAQTRLSAAFPEISAILNYSNVDVMSAGMNKAAGINKYLEYAGLAAAAVYTVGDGENDAPMLRAYNGYAMENSAPEALAAAKNKTRSVEELINKLVKI